jgi:hypothetical protein
MKIIESINRDVLQRSIARAREKGVLLPPLRSSAILPKSRPTW